jgi:hypothetical protein
LEIWFTTSELHFTSPKASKSSTIPYSRKAGDSVNGLCLLPAVAGLLAWLSTPTSAQSLDPSFYYKRSTQFRGDGMKLDRPDRNPPAQQALRSVCYPKGMTRAWANGNDKRKWQSQRSAL